MLATVFSLLRGRATFARLGEDAAGMSVISDGLQHAGQAAYVKGLAQRG